MGDNNSSPEFYEQVGGKIEAQDTNDLSGPKIDPNSKTIDMKIKLVKEEDAATSTLPSYLIPSGLSCVKDGVTTSITTGSVVTMTLSGTNLQKVTPAPTNFTCEITSNFLTGTEKPAITIETYYQDSSLAIVHNTIYFDESLLKCYDSSKALQISPNPFLAKANTTDDGATYKFAFDFDKIITSIKALPAYELIQKMFKLAYGVPIGNTSKACLIKISDDAFLNINFKGIPFVGTIVNNDGALILNISTTQPPDVAECDFSSLVGPSLKLQNNLKDVLALKDYKNFDFTNLASPPTPPTPSPAPEQPAPPKVEVEVKDTDLSGISGAMGDLSGDDKTKVDSSIQAVADAAADLEAAKKENDNEKIEAAKAKLKAACDDPKVQEAIDAGLATDSALPPSVKNVINGVKQLKDNIAAAASKAASSASSKMSVGAPSTSADAALQDKLQASMDKYQQSLVLIQQSIKELQTAMSQLSKGGQGMGGISPKVLLGAPGKQNICGTGGVEIKSNGDNLTINVPISLVMSEIMNPQILEKYGAGAGGGGGGGGGNGGNLTFEAKEPSLPNQPSQQQQLKQQQQQPPINVQQQPPINVQKPQQPQQPDGSKPQNNNNNNPPPPVVITISPKKQTELDDAAEALTSLKQQLKDAEITPEPDQIVALDTAIKDAKTAVVAFETATDKNVAKTAAETKIDTATGLVAAAKTAVDAAIAGKPKPPPSDDAAVAAKIKELKDKLEAIRKTFEAAKGKLAGITPPPNPVIDPTGATDALDKADTAITAIGSETTAEAKATAITTAEGAVKAAENAVNDFSNKVDAAVAAAGKPTGESVPEYTAYEAAYKAYTAAKEAYDAALKQASDTAPQFGGAKRKATEAEIEAAKAALNKSLKTLVIDTNTSGIKKIESEDEFNKLTEAGAKQEAITKLTEATQVYTDSLKKLTELQATYNAAVADKDEEPAPAPAPEGEETETEEEEKKKAAAAAAAAEAKSGAEAEKAPEAQAKAGAEAEAAKKTKIAELQEQIQNFQTQIDQIKSEKEGAKLTEEQNEQQATLQEQLDAAQNELKKLQQPEAAATVTGGGSTKAKSASKSALKPSSKNKTKKNHSKSNPNPNKSKTPKIKMNE